MFSSFDLAQINGQFLVTIIVRIFILQSYWKSNRKKFITTLFLRRSSAVFLPNLNKRNRQGSINIIVLVFVSFLVINLNSVRAFNTPLTSQASIVFFIGLAIWTSFIMFQLNSSSKGVASHLTPEGSPIYLAPILVLIECVRIIIRPITISVRIMANILAGHLLIILLARLVISIKLRVVLYVMLNLIEIFVACIQAYIFTTITCLYYSES